MVTNAIPEIRLHRYGSVDVVLCTLLVLISNGAGHIDIGADGKSDEQVGEQIDNGSRGTNGLPAKNFLQSGRLQ